MNKKLAFFAFILGVIAIFGGNPQTNSKVAIDTEDLAIQIENKDNRITVADLSDWIIKEKLDFRLIDIRDVEKYNEYHIPLAENMAVTDFNTEEMPRNSKYLLISDSDVISGQAWFLLKARGYKGVYIVCGGMDEWKNTILFPKLLADATTDDIAEFEKIKQVSLFFGGSPQEGVSTASDDQIKLDLPKLQQVQVKVKRKKILQKEGC
ncbi:rhodanese-like domain-containing protein [Bacteroidota bacterium]